jgi:hypothetical protein
MLSSSECGAPMPVPASNVFNDKAHLDELVKLDAREQWAVKYLYDRLGIIDNKTSALLRFNAVAMGFLAVLATRIGEPGSAVQAPKLLLGLSLLTFAMLAVAEYEAFRIFYLHFDRIAGGRTFDDYKNTFFEITCERGKRYRTALWVSGLGGMLFTLLFAVLILQKISGCFSMLLGGLP